MGHDEGRTGVTAARGFRASTLYCGIRKKEQADLTLLVSDAPATCAGVFTTNLVKAAPLTLSESHLAATGGRARAVVINAGNANACTGEQGLAAARRTAEAAARLLGLDAREVLVSSTGVIGQQLPVEKLLGCLPDAVSRLSFENGHAAAEGIMTTDLVAKESVRRVDTEAGEYVVGAMAKGSGMIHPNMATMMAFVTTDAAIEPGLLKRALVRANEVSFNRITVDGDTSTNDMALVFANGASGVTIGDAELERFELALTAVLVDLAKAIARDGEGAEKLITVTVTGALTEADALQVSRTIAGSPLVKTAVHGADANWGRIVAAAGRAGVALDPGRLRVGISGVEVLAPGYVSCFSEEDAKAALLKSDVTLCVDLGLGSESATTWTCDLTPGYIAINASYRS